MTDTDVDKTVDLQERSTIRKGINALRREGMTPGVSSAGKHHPLELKVGSDKYLALIKDAQFNPVKRRLDHVVFQAISRNVKVNAEIPVRIEGDAPAEKLGLMILTQLDHVEVEALPRNLPDELTVDAEKLAELNDAITVEDIKAPDGVVILTEMDHPIARVVETPAQVSEEAEAEGEEAADGAEEIAEDNTEEGTAKESAE
jgi:large subunit ribosomal protein L25